MESVNYLETFSQIQKEISLKKTQYKTKLKQLNQKEKQVRKIKSLLKKEQFCALKIMLQDKNVLLAPELTEELQQFIQIELKTMREQYPSLLDDEFSQAGFTLDKLSRHPKYSLFHSLIQIEIDESNCKAKMISLSGKKIYFPADIDTIVSNVKKHYQRLTKQRYEPSVFLKELSLAYHKMPKEKNKSQYVPIKKVIPYFHRKKYEIDEFAMDFSRLVQSGLNHIDNEYLDIQHCKDERKGILLYGLSQRMFIGEICFKGENNE